MSRAQKLLLLVIALELVEFGLVLRARHNQPPLPRVNLSRFMPETAEDIGHFQDHVDRAKADDWLDLADKYRTFGLYPEADYCFRQGHALGPARKEYLLRWAIALDRAGRFEESLERYDKAAAATPRQGPECSLHAGLIHLRLGRYEQAEELLHKASALPKAKVMLARRLIRSGRAQIAATMLDELLRQFPDDLVVNELRGWAEEERGDRPASWLYLERSLRGSREIRLDDEATAKVDQERRAAVGDRGVFQKCQALADQGKAQEAIDLLRGTSGAFAEPGGHVNIATWQIQLHRLPQAKQTLQECLAHFGGCDVSALQLLGDVEAELGNPQQARFAWQQAIDLQADDELHQRLADSFRQAGDKALAERHKALAKFHQAKAAWLKNDLQTAKEQLQAVSRTLDDHAPTWFYLGETLRFLGHDAASQDAYQHCLRINPDHGRALRGLERLTKKRAAERRARAT